MCSSAGAAPTEIADWEPKQQKSISQFWRLRSPRSWCRFLATAVTRLADGGCVFTWPMGGGRKERSKRMSPTKYSGVSKFFSYRWRAVLYSFQVYNIAIRQIYITYGVTACGVSSCKGTRRILLDSDPTCVTSFNLKKNYLLKAHLQVESRWGQDFDIHIPGGHSAVRHTGPTASSQPWSVCVCVIVGCPLLVALMSLFSLSDSISIIGPSLTGTVAFPFLREEEKSWHFLNTYWALGTSYIHSVSYQIYMECQLCAKNYSAH